MIFSKPRSQGRPSLPRLIAGLVPLGLVALAGISKAAADSWYFSAAEIEIAYRYQERFGRRLLRPVKPSACDHGGNEFSASYQGHEIVAPCKFIGETRRHLKAMIEWGAARYLFPLDADHAHLAVPTEVWDAKYHGMPAHQALEQALREPRLAALYHTAEHLRIDSEVGGTSSQINSWRDKRNVLGFFDGRPLEILPPRQDGSAQAMPGDYTTVATVYFLAHRLGEIIFSVQDRAVSFDLTFDEDFGPPTR